jgi:hypothetical protein
MNMMRIRRSCQCWYRCWPKHSEATVRGNIASTYCFIDVFSPSSMEYAGLYGVASLPYLDLREGTCDATSFGGCVASLFCRP